MAPMANPRNSISSSGMPDIAKELAGAVDRGETKRVKELIAQGAYVNSVSGDWTPLRRAAFRGHTAIVKIFLDANARLNDTDHAGYTALTHAAFRGRTDIVKLLLDRGADPNIRTRSQWTALMCAAWEGHAEAVRLLLDKGADPAPRNNRGQTARALAESAEHPSITALLPKR